MIEGNGDGDNSGSVSNHHNTMNGHAKQNGGGGRGGSKGPPKRINEDNVVGEKLAMCSDDPVTGFMRTGYCQVPAGDRGNHSVCAEVTREFLEYSKSMGNDLTRASPQYGFPGLKPGDRWCLCAGRWKEAERAGVAPRVILDASHKVALNSVRLDDLKQYTTTD